MNLLRLQKVLGDRIEVTLNRNLTPEQREEENAQSLIIIGLAKQMINNGDLILRTEKLQAQSRSLRDSVATKLVQGDL